MRYRVELEELLAFANRLQSFEWRVEELAGRVGARVDGLHVTWCGEAARAHRAQHDEWIASATQMREAVEDLRVAARDAHRHYVDAARLNLDMLR